MLFRDVAIGPRWLAIFGVLTLVFLAMVAAIATPVLVAGADQVSGWLLALVIGAFLLILGAGALGVIRRVTITVSSSHVDAYLTPFRVMHIPIGAVRRVEVAEVTPRQAGGIGWRFVGQDRFILWSSGPAVWLTLADGRVRVLGSARAQELRDTIENTRARTHSHD